MKLIKGIIIGLISMMLFTSCREKIDAGNVGLLIDQYGTDKGQGVEIVSGAVWYNPWTKDVEQVPTFVQHKDYETFSVTDKDGSEWSITPKLNYHVVKGVVADTYKKYRKSLPELEEQIIKTIVQETYRVTINNYSTDSTMRSREKIESQCKLQIKKSLETEGFYVDQLTSGMKPPATISAAVNAKNQAVQDAMRIENEVKSTQAEGMKKVAAAKANYDASILNARAEAESNKLRQQTLTPMLIQQQFIEKWDGKLPQYGQVPSIMKQIQ